MPFRQKKSRRMVGRKGKTRRNTRRNTRRKKTLKHGRRLKGGSPPSGNGSPPSGNGWRRCCGRIKDRCGRDAETVAYGTAEFLADWVGKRRRRREVAEAEAERERQIELAQIEMRREEEDRWMEEEEWRAEQKFLAEEASLPRRRLPYNSPGGRFGLEQPMPSRKRVITKFTEVERDAARRRENWEDGNAGAGADNRCGETYYADDGY